MAVEVRREKKADNSAGRCPPASGRVALESARQWESNGIGFEESALLYRSAGRQREILQRADVRQSREGSH